MKTKEEIINAFLEKLKNQSSNTLILKNKDNDIREVFEGKFGIVCLKCGSTDIFVSWEEGVNYGGYTGYSPGQKLFKCNTCGNAVSLFD